MVDKSDPTKDLEFQNVIRHFVTTPHKPHEKLGKLKPKHAEKANPAKGRKTRKA